MEKVSCCMKKVGKIYELIQMFLRKISRDKVRAHAAEAAFFVIMSAFPILMLLLTLIQFTPLTPQQVLFALEEITPFSLSDIIEPEINRLFSQSSALVPWTALVAVWAAGKGMMGLTDGLNSVYQHDETRGYIATRIRSACYTVVLIFTLIICLGVLVFGYSLQNYLKRRILFLKKYPDTALILPMCIALVIMILAFTLFYKFLPNHKMSFKSQLPGAIFTAVAWAVFSYAFSIYLEFAENMSVIYGSLTTLVVVMLWLYICMYLLFIGAEINHYIAYPELFTLDR